MSDADALLARAAPGRRLHLDSEYKNHKILFLLNDGRIEDSRLKNWREIEWEKVQRLIVSIKGVDHIIEPHPRGHQFFLCFRQVIDAPLTDTIGRVVVDRSEGQRKAMRIKHHLWTVGVTDGKTCFLVDIDFHTGRKVNEYVRPLASLLSHIHPRIVALNQLHREIH